MIFIDNNAHQLALAHAISPAKNATPKLVWITLGRGTTLLASATQWAGTTKILKP